MPEPTPAPPMPMAPPGASPVPAGPTAPATTTPPTAGLQARVPMLVGAALKPLREALRLLDPLSPQGQQLYKAMTILAKEFGTPSPDLTRADMKLLGEKAGGVSPANPSAFADMQRGIAANRVGQSPTPQAPAMMGAGGP